MSRIGAVIAIAVLLALGGCTTEAKLDTSTTAREIKRDIAAQTGAHLRAVRCPTEVVAKKGDVFRCRAIASDGSRIPVRVTQIDGKGGVRWRIGR